jgi:EF hand
MLKKLTSLHICAVALLLAGGVHAQSNEFATGNMHFDAKDMDTNGDHMISREEMIAYAEMTWDKMAQGKATIPISAAAKDFASGGVNFKARAIDTDHDGTISKEEYVAYATRKFDSMKNKDDMVSVDDMARAIARGNTYPAGDKAKAAKDPSK